MRRDFEDGVYWDELAEICGEISKAVEFRGAARNTVQVCMKMKFPDILPLSRMISQL